MNDFEKWYQFCMRCEYAYKRIDDAETVYCSKGSKRCLYLDEIEQKEKEKKDNDR